MQFEFATAQRIIFGAGRRAELPTLIQGLGRRPALVTGANAERVQPIFKLLKEVRSVGYPYPIGVS